MAKIGVMIGGKVSFLFFFIKEFLFKVDFGQFFWLWFGDLC
jgi:hypothetical protein